MTFQRVFAAELNITKAQLTTGKKGEKPLLTPGGALLSRVFCAGALIERHGCGDETAYARLADPTGAFSLQADRQSMDGKTILCGLEIPCFVTVTGRPFLIGSGDSSRCIIRIEDIRAVDRYVRDVWVLHTAGLTLKRLAALDTELGTGNGDPRIDALRRCYNLDGALLREIAGRIAEAVRSVQVKQVSVPVQANPASVVLGIIREHGGKAGISLDEITRRAVAHGLSPDEVKSAVEVLCREDECYQPGRGIYKAL
ncbi:MAG: hypothetical protein NQU46_04115 [Methanolinea sp.]|nr:hypothetical protein [Methanolinea sp.]